MGNKFFESLKKFSELDDDAKFPIIYISLILLFGIIVGLVFGVPAACERLDDYKHERAREKKIKKEEDNINKLNKMLEECDFSGAHNWLRTRYDEYQRDEYKEVTTYYIPHALKVLKTEGSYLMDKNDEEAERAFLMCANDIASNLGNQIIQVGTFDKDSYGEVRQANGYISQITPYNMALYSILCEAIIRDKPEFAKKILSLMEKNYKVEEIKTKKGDTSYVIKEDKQTYNEALQEIKKYEASH